MLGMAIGVAAFIAMVSFGNGARRAVVSQFEKLGINMLSVAPAGARPGGQPPLPLTDSDVEALTRQTTLVDYVVPVRSANTFLVYEGVQIASKLRATTPKFFEINDWPFDLGGSFDAIDMKQARRVCVLGARPAELLFKGRDPLGQVVSVHGKLSCRVIGILSSKGAATSGRDLDDVVVVPAPTYFAYISSQKAYSSFDIRPIQSATRLDAQTEIRGTLRHAHGLKDDADDDFVIRSSDDAIAVASSVANILSGLLAGIAGVSLLVGGIGIMNIQLVAVAERTREIGIRSAIGASPQQILNQFLAEAVVLALCGTLIGALAGVAMALAVAQAMRWEQAISVGALLLSVAFGGSVGVLFGYLPAARAARLDPIEALRRE